MAKKPIAAAATSAVTATPASTAAGAASNGPAAAGVRKLKVSLEHCYGIKKLDTTFDFCDQGVYALYAANGAMKSSLAQTFKDVADGAPSKDRVFPARHCQRRITDGHGMDIPPESIVVVLPYDESVGHTEKTSTLLVNPKLRREFEALHQDIDKSKELLLSVLRKQSQSKRDLEREISSSFTASDESFFTALGRVRSELEKQKDAPFAGVPYDMVFDEKVLELLGGKNVKDAINAYIKKYNELLAASTYFKKGVFNYHNAATIAKSLADNGFFDAKHTVNLNGGKTVKVTNAKELEEVIQLEKDAILKDKALRAQFDDIDKKINKNQTVREFQKYLADNEWILPELANIDEFREKVWKSYLKANFELYADLMAKYQAAEAGRQKLEEQATRERTQWEEVIGIFNDRFFVPFVLEAANRNSVILGQEAILQLGFKYKDGTESMDISKDDLLKVLSTGEKKAFYILNIIFEVQARQKDGQATIFVIDDVADSFDYRNKYAIVQYLKDIAEEPLFRQIILTHNFDFFRTLNSRFVGYSNCLMATKDGSGVTLEKAVGIKNIFVKDWKPNFASDARKRIASIPFIRNLVEFTLGEQDSAFVKLTSLLHRKADSASITQADLDTIYNGVFRTTVAWGTPTEGVVDAIMQEADRCLEAPAGINFENKIVLSIAARLKAEAFIMGKLGPAAVGGITSNQTSELLKRYKNAHSSDQDNIIHTLEQVVLLTPENIHLNSFMYEPIVDMSDEHLRRLYQEVSALR